VLLQILVRAFRWMRPKWVSSITVKAPRAKSSSAANEAGLSILSSHTKALFVHLQVDVMIFHVS